VKSINDLPDYIDNSNFTLESVLKQLIFERNQLVLDIATGFFRIEAWIRLEKELNYLTSLRLLIGRDPSINPADSGTIDLTRYFRNKIHEQLETQPFNRNYKQQIDRLIGYLQKDDVQVRLFGVEGERNQFFHAKAYIFDDYSIVGSSNFTPSGLANNTELNILIKQKSVSQNLRTEWFQKFWEDPSVDLDYKSKLIDALNASKFGSKPYTPYQVFVKALYELFKDDIGLSTNDGTTLELASFQQEGFERAVRLLNRHHGCMIADSVGLGKTYIGLRLIEHYLNKDRQPGYVPKALIICPAQMQDLLWVKKLDEAGIKANVISQEKLGGKGFDVRQYSRYDLVIVDESHNFRNSGTNRYRNLQLLLGSGKHDKRVVLLTATPINNSIFDLYHQIMLLMRGKEIYRSWGISNLKSYFQNLNKGRNEITELLLQTTVRRSRQDVIKRQQAGEKIMIAGKEIHFPMRQLEQFTYNFETNFQGLYSGIAEQIDRLQLAPYNIRSAKRKLNDKDKVQVKKNDALVALMKSLWLKRLESSLIAFENSISTQLNFQKEFAACLDRGKLLDSKNFRKIIAAETDDDENIQISELIESLDNVDAKDYDLDRLKEQIADDFHILEDILSKLERIRSSVEQNKEHDRKLDAFKNLLQNLKGQKIIVFSYFKDTAEYVAKSLMNDEKWLQMMQSNSRKPVIDTITGKTHSEQRPEKVRRFAPNANSSNEDDRQAALKNPIDILICTDVLSEGQNLQDAGILINYDLHWNPVRMIQRAGRIDRLGSTFDKLFIYNCFPEEGLEDLLGLVARLQSRIATIDETVRLDASVLGEVISDRSLQEIRRLKEAHTDAEKAAILEELEQITDLVSLDEMRFPLIEFGKEAAEKIPFGIHSTRTDGSASRDGVFLAFRARERHFWHFYPRIRGRISTDPANLISDLGEIFRLLQCKQSDYPNPAPVIFDNDIFDVLEGATDNLLQELQKCKNSSLIPRKLPNFLDGVHTKLTEDLSVEVEIDDECRIKLLKVIRSVDLQSYKLDIEKLWDLFNHDKQLNNLICNLDELFIDRELYHDIDEPEASPLEMIQAGDIQLVCYQWFKPQVRISGG
jgi:superfamily II DNA or RNA helicase